MGLGSSTGISTSITSLVRDGHDVVLVDFEAAKHSCQSEELEKEMSALESSLEDERFWGGVERLLEQQISSGSYYEINKANS